jgi:hypothetical protein
MSKHLYFICPTDHLEMVIKQTFKQEHYFYTSLGNSVVLNSETVGQINNIIESKKIKEVTFLLSVENDIIQAILRNNKYAKVKGMSNFDCLINKHLSNINFNQAIEEIELELISNHLNQKVNAFRLKLNEWFIKRITINALIYYPQKNAFIKVNSKLFKLDHFYLN